MSDEINYAEDFRPISFDEIVGQDTAIKAIARNCSDKTPAPFYLLYGASGAGKTTVSRVIALTLNCMEPSVSEKTGWLVPCGECIACAAILQGNEQFIREFDGARYSKVDDTRTVLSELQMSVREGRWKVFVGEEIHRLSKNAFDAWLRYVEKPPKRHIIIFCTTEYNRVPPTISGRASNKGHYFRNVPHSLMIERLKHICKEIPITYDENDLLKISEMSQGSLRVAIKKLEDYAITQEIAADMGDQYGGVSTASVIAVLNNIFSGNKEKAYWDISKIWMREQGLSIQDVVDALLQHVVSMTLPFTLKYHGWNKAEIKELDRQISRMGEGSVLVLKRELSTLSLYVSQNPQADSALLGYILSSLYLELTKYKSDLGKASMLPVSTMTDVIAPLETYKSPLLNLGTADNLKWLAEEVFGGNYRMVGNRATIKSKSGNQVDVVMSKKDAVNKFYIDFADFGGIIEMCTNDESIGAPDLIEKGLIKQRA